MQLRILKLALFYLAFNFQSHVLAQSISISEYQVINDLFGEKSGPENFSIYKYAASYSVYEMILNQNINNIDVPNEIDPKEFRTIIESFQSQKNAIKELPDKESEWKRKFLDKKIKLKPKSDKGNLISRPVISGYYSILYIKTYKNSYIEEYIIAKKNNEKWERYGSYFISSKFIDTLVR